jgi:hypothetical protein
MAVERKSHGPATIPVGIAATPVKVYIGNPDEFSEEVNGVIQTFRVLPGGAIWSMPKDYVLPHVFRVENRLRHYLSKNIWFEDGVKVEEQPYALTT